MVSRDAIIESMMERIKFQVEYLKDNPNDRTARYHLDAVRNHLNMLENHKEDTEEKYYVAHNIDYRIHGNDHSEVSYTVEFVCCEPCCRAIHWWLASEHRTLAGRNSGYYYSFGNVQRNEKVTGEVGQKVIKYRARSISESLDSDEMRINSGWLD